MFLSALTAVNSDAQKTAKARRRYCMPDPFAVLTDELLVSQIPQGSRVLDLGCGDGRLLQELRDQRQCAVMGIELDFEQFKASMNRGIPVLRGDLDHGLGLFPNDSFDVAVLSQTLQQVRQPKPILQEILRVARQALVVVPNFAHWRVRWQLGFHGRAPVTSFLPYEWYDTPNLHVMTMHDFRDLAAHVHAKIVRELPIIRGRAVEHAWFANLRADSALFVLQRDA